MPNAAFTIVQNDMILLKLWLKYYSKYFDTLYVIGNGTKEEYGNRMALLNEKYGVIYERLPTVYGDPDFLGNSERTIQKIKEIQIELLKTHTWVLYSDCDEYIVADPSMYEDLTDFMNRFEKDKVYCVAYNILQMMTESPIDYFKPYLLQREYWAKDERYNKPLLAKIPLNWAPGCHREMDIHDTDTKKMENKGLLLLHLKYADLNAIEGHDMGPVRTMVDSGIIEEGMKIKEKIPEKIRRLF